jgi:hypothetical protein
MLAMLLRCHHCGQDFPGGVPVRKYWVRGELLGGVIYDCPFCGAREAYIPAEYRIGELRGFVVVPRPGPPVLAPSPPQASAYP